MTTTNVTIGSTYTEVTTASSFIAQNAHHLPQEWARASSAPAETITGIIINPKQGLNSDSGSGKLYARGAGEVTVIT